MKKDLKVEVKVEWNGQIIYIEDERVNCLTKTIVTQDERHHMTTECEVYAEVFVDAQSEGFGGKSGLLPYMKWDLEKKELRTPNGVLVPNAQLVSKDEEWIWVAFKFEKAKFA